MLVNFDRVGGWFRNPKRSKKEDSVRLLNHNMVLLCSQRDLLSLNLQKKKNLLPIRRVQKFSCEALLDFVFYLNIFLFLYSFHWPLIRKIAIWQFIHLFTFLLLPVCMNSMKWQRFPYFRSDWWFLWHFQCEFQLPVILWSLPNI